VGPSETSPRQKRMQRWAMHFTTGNGADYLQQLAGLGAILAVPVRESGSEYQYKVIRDLSRRPPPLLDEDVRKIGRIYWIDQRPASVAEVMAELGLPLRPSHFVAFMPAELEAKLLEVEKAQSGGRPEEDILETHFRVQKHGDRYVPVLESIRLR
jgi:hypothetical protein